MLRGFPADFPVPKRENGQQEGTEEGGGGLFVRSEDIYENVTFPAVKKAKIVIETFIDTEGSLVFKHVKFSGEPPIQFDALPDCEYDRSPLLKHVEKWKSFNIEQ